MVDPSDDSLWRLSQTMAYLSCSKAHLYRLKEAGLLVPVDIGLSGRACWRWQRSDVERFVKKGERG
jgi:predicted DNA-binding transcriptional regulator AlpA